MDEKPIITNSFEKGVIADYDPQKLGNKMLTYSLNGRVIYNRNGTLSWVNARGTRLAIALGFNYGQSNNYKVIGGIEISNYLILLSTQNTVNNVGANQLNSEIGILTENQPGIFVYQTVFNDQYDPNGDLLHLNTRYQAKMQASMENKNIIRGYWCDDFNEDRVFNIVAGQNPIIFGGNGINYFAKPYLPYTVQPTVGNNGVQQAVAGALYPYWYSVHSMNELVDVQYGIIKYQKNISGSKLAGTRQYFYRLVTASGFATPWSTGSGMIFCTVPDVSAAPLPAGGNFSNSLDWTQYCMVNSGTVTKKGHQLEIKYIDRRFTYIEVAWAYYQSNVSPISAGVFFKGLITATSMIISDVNETVITPISDPTTLIQRYTDVIHSKTKVINENYHHKGNAVLRPVIEIDTTGITIEPYLRLMSSDLTTTLAPNRTPLTKGLAVTNDTVTVNLFDGWNESYVIGDTGVGSQDYINYKGTQWDCLFKGEFRGETVPLAIVLFSRKGQPFFAQHIGDFTMPEQYDDTWTNTTLNSDGTLNVVTGTTNAGINQAAVNGYTLTTNQPGTIFPVTDKINLGVATGMGVKILGKSISGIDLTDVLYDQYGKLQISGFSIVRADRIPNLIAQGLIMNCGTGAPQDEIPIVGIGNFIFPLHSTGNAYFDFAPSPLGGPVGLPASYQGGTVHFNNENIDHGHTGFIVANSGLGEIAGNYFTLELPDNLLNPAIISNVLQGNTQAQNTGFNIKIVGNTQAQYVTEQTENGCNDFPLSGILPSILVANPGADGNGGNFYTKNYLTTLTPPGPNILVRSDQGIAPPTAHSVPVGFYAVSGQLGDWGSIIPVDKMWNPFPTNSNSSGGNNPVAVGQSNDIDNYRFENVSWLACFFPESLGINDTGIYHSLGTNTQVLIKSSSYANASLSVGIPDQLDPFVNPICYYLVNLISNQQEVLNQSILDGREYFNIGHFVPINTDTVAAATQPSGRVVFNHCEVWGGDCYVDFFDYARLIPLYDNANSPSQTPAYFDYGCGLIFPCETIYNHTMRIGNKFAGVGMRPGVDETLALLTNPLFYEGMYANALDSTDARFEDFQLNAVMQATDKIEAFNSKGIYFVDEPDQPLIEMVSNIKIPGETYDQFRLFLVNNNQPADSQYGWICDMQALGHNIYVLQEKGFGRIRFNEYTMQSTSTDNLTVGTGQGYQGHVYMGGSDFGCQHEWSVVNDKKSIWWVNAYKGKHNRFGGNGLECVSDLFGQHQYFTFEAEQYWQVAQVPGSPLPDTNENIYDNPVDIGGISSVYDFRNRSEITTFTQRKIFDTTTQPGKIVLTGTASTMEFNEGQSAYQGNWSYANGIYFSFKRDFFAYDDKNPQNLYEFNRGNRGEFFGVVYDSEMEFIVQAKREFIYDNAEIDTNPQAFGVIKTALLTTDNGQQPVTLNNPATDNRPVYRNSSLLYPTMQNNQNVRMRGSFMRIKYTVDNTTNTKVLISENRTFIRPDKR